ncbi:SET domain protein [Lentinula edodes]|nr:SET domain protein [Lentinula edodes]
MKAHKNVVEPSHWPKYLRYTQSYIYHSSVSLEVKKTINEGPKSSQRSSSSQNHNSQNHNHVVIRHITEPSHPAYNQFGLFASKKIPAKAHILDYIGEIHADERLTSDYDLSLLRLQNGESIGIDASTTGNEARFINDYRGIKLKPNAAFIDYRTDSGELKMGIWAANEDIKKGDELLVSYGKAWWKARTELQ